VVLVVLVVLVVEVLKRGLVLLKGLQPLLLATMYMPLPPVRLLLHSC
jgi:hypothetical protein